MREIRKIDLDASASGVAPDITTMTVPTIQWEDSGGSIYRLVKAGTDLQLQIGGGTIATLLTDVSALTISIFDEDNVDLGVTCSAATCDPVRRVGVDVTTSRNGATESLRFKVFIRSTMSGAQGGA